MPYRLRESSAASAERSGPANRTAAAAAAQPLRPPACTALRRMPECRSCADPCRSCAEPCCKFQALWSRVGRMRLFHDAARPWQLSPVKQLLVICRRKQSKPSTWRCAPNLRQLPSTICCSDPSRGSTKMSAGKRMGQLNTTYDVSWLHLLKAILLLCLHLVFTVRRMQLAFLVPASTPAAANCSATELSPRTLSI